MDRQSSIPPDFKRFYMILYTEEQLENAYNVYRRHQIKQDMSFLKLEDFRLMFEEIMEWVYYEPEEDRGH